MAIKLNKAFLSLLFLSRRWVGFSVFIVVLVVFCWLTFRIQLLEIQKKALLQDNRGPVVYRFCGSLTKYLRQNEKKASVQFYFPTDIIFRSTSS